MVVGDGGDAFVQVADCISVGVVGVVVEAVGGVVVEAGFVGGVVFYAQETVRVLAIISVLQVVDINGLLLELEQSPAFHVLDVALLVVGERYVVGALKVAGFVGELGIWKPEFQRM